MGWGGDGSAPAPESSAPAYNPRAPFSSQILRVIDSHKGAVQACYDVEAVKDPSLNGTLTVGWNIQRDGTVTYAHVVQTTINVPRLSDCIVRQVMSWRFPEYETPTYNVTYAFKLGPQNSE
jgi:hypothetical protein